MSKRSAVDDVCPSCYSHHAIVNEEVRFSDYECAECGYEWTRKNKFAHSFAELMSWLLKIELRRMRL